MPAARLRIVVLLGLGLLALGAGHAGGARHAVAPQLVGFDEYYEPVGDFEATQLVRLDPVTLGRLPGRPLKLHDFGASRVLGPDGRTLAIGGYNYGEVVLVDLRRLARTAWLPVAPRLPGNTEIGVVSWPRPDRLLATVSRADGPALVSSSVIVIDPVRRRVVRRLPFGRDWLMPLPTHDGAVFLVGPVDRTVPARLVIADAEGRTRTIVLRRILAGQNRNAGFASDGRRAFVVGARGPIAAVDLGTLAVAYHEGPGLTAAHLPITAPEETGSAGPQLAFTRDASWLGKGRLLVTGQDEFPTAGDLVRWVTHDATVVDTRTWRIQHVFANVSTLRLVDGVLLGSGSRWDGKREVGPGLVAFLPDGRPLYSRRTPDFSWNVVAGRLIAHEGSRLVELDVRTGRPFRELASASAWPLDGVFDWTPR